MNDINTSEFIIFSHNDHDTKLTHSFITHNHFKILKIKASPGLSNFLHTFQAKSYDKLLKTWTTFKNTFKYQKHTYVRPSYTKELILKEIHNAKQNITALTYTALNHLLSTNKNQNFKKAHDYITTQILFKNINSLTIKLNNKQLQTSITKYPFTRILFPNITPITTTQDTASNIKICSFNINGLLHIHLRPEHSYMQELVAKHKTDILILLESHCTTQAPTILNYKTIAHKKCNANSQFPIGGIIIYIKSYLTNIHHLHTSNNHDIIWLQIKHIDNTLTHIAACYTRTAIKNHQQINSEFFNELHTQIIKFKELGEVIILGKLNTRLGNITHDLTNLSPSTNSNASLLTNIINSENLTILNTKHQLGIKTYHKKSLTSNKIASSIIDYCLITGNTSYNYFQILTSPRYNDHRPLLLSIPLIHKTNPTKQKIYKLKYIKETYDSEEYETTITKNIETLKIITKHLNHKDLIKTKSLQCAKLITIALLPLMEPIHYIFWTTQSLFMQKLGNLQSSVTPIVLAKTNNTTKL